MQQDCRDRGRRVRDTSGEPVAVNTDEEREKTASGHRGFYCQEAGHDNKQRG